MATWTQVQRIARQLPETEEDGLSWRVRSKLYAWERPLRKGDRPGPGAAANTKTALDRAGPSGQPRSLAKQAGRGCHGIVSVVK